MSRNDICFMSAVEMKKKIESQEIPSQEIVETIIERINKINPIINAYCTTTFEIAREAAKNADEAVKKGEKLGLLNGIPTSIKDLMQTKGVRTTYGSKLHENFMPEENDIAVQRLLDAGCVMMGKTNTPEFGHMAVTDNLIFGKTLNPWNLERTSGGSSGGAGASVASGLSPLALGSDGGGSIRIPSSFCGVYGLKPTFGRIPRYPPIGIAFWSMDHYGPLTNFVADAALMLTVMKGHHPYDKNSFPDDGINYLEKVEEKPKNLKIGYNIGLGFSKAIEPEVEKVVIDSAQKLEKFNWTVENAKLKIRKPEMSFNTQVTAGYGYDLNKDLKKRREDLSPNLIKLIEAGISYSALDIGQARAQRQKVYFTMNKYFESYDILITPTTPISAFELGIMYPPRINNKNVSPVAFMHYTFPFNMTGLPAASIPCGWSSEGTPIGMQIVGKQFNDLLVLQVSKAFEEVQPWQDKKPSFN